MIGAWGFDKLVSGEGDKLLEGSTKTLQESTPTVAKRALVHRAHSKVERSNVSAKSGDAVQTLGMPSSHRGGHEGGGRAQKGVGRGD